MEKPHDVWENSRLAGATGCLCCVHYATALSELHLMGDIWILGRIWSTLVFCAEESEKKWKDKNSNKKLVPSCANVLYFTSFKKKKMVMQNGFSSAAVVIGLVIAFSEPL